MRIWSLHPKYLDSKGLIACWRETLLAQKVLSGTTKGYTKHPQLVRFRALGEHLAENGYNDGGLSTANQIEMAAIGIYLQQLAEEAQSRGYNFNRNLIVYPPESTTTSLTINVTKGQLQYEWHHLLAKLKKRSPDFLSSIVNPADDVPHVSRLFQVIPGDIEPWEIVADDNKKRRKSSSSNNDNNKRSKVNVKASATKTATATTTDTNRRVTRSQLVNVTTTKGN